MAFGWRGAGGRRFALAFQAFPRSVGRSVWLRAREKGGLTRKPTFSRARAKAKIDRKCRPTVPLFSYHSRPALAWGRRGRSFICAVQHLRRHDLHASFARRAAQARHTLTRRCRRVRPHTIKDNHV
jgi:hypothetical protein